MSAAEKRYFYKCIRGAYVTVARWQWRGAPRRGHVARVRRRTDGVLCRRRRRRRRKSRRKTYGARSGRETGRLHRRRVGGQASCFHLDALEKHNGRTRAHTLHGRARARNIYTYMRSVYSAQCRRS